MDCISAVPSRGAMARLPPGEVFRSIPPQRRRVRTFAPTEYPERWLPSCRDRSQTGPRARTVRPYGEKRSGGVGSADSGANVESHHLKFSTTPGPLWAGRKCSASLRFCAPEIFHPAKGMPPVMGSRADSPCQGEMSRSDRGGRYGGDLEHRNGAPRSKPLGGSLASFWPSRKKLAAAAAKPRRPSIYQITHSNIENNTTPERRYAP